MRNYTDFSKLQTYEERLHYLEEFNRIGEETFGSKRYLNQIFYQSEEWKAIRNEVILRDNGCDLGIPGLKICGVIYVHHMNSITIEDILNRNPDIINPEYLICTSYDSHKYIHYGGELPCTNIITRFPNDTCPWK